MHDKVNSDKTMNLLKLKIGMNHLICLNHVMKLYITRKDVRGVDASARAINHLQIRLQICLAILAPVANWEIGNYRLGMYVELCFVSAPVIFQVIICFLF